MPANRVEELERSVEELRSTVEGVTDELVEAKERIRVLEAELDTDAPTRVPDRREDGEDRDAEHSPSAPRTATPPTESAFDENAESAEEEAEDSGTSDIIIA